MLVYFLYLRKIEHLRKIFAISLLLVFALRPVYYLGCIGYYELNINTIIEKYCINKDMPELNCDGKCYLAQQLNKASNSNDTENDKYLNVISQSFMPVYFSAYQDVKFQSCLFKENKESKLVYLNNYSFLQELNNLKPPIF